MTALAALVAGHPAERAVGLVIARSCGGAVEVACGGDGVSGEAVFELGSITKAVTGLLLADAVVRGEVELDTTLDLCLGGARAVRLSDLASHTAGLPRLPLALLRRNRSVWPSASFDPYAATTVAQLVEDLAGVRMRKPRFRYSNFGAALLGQALAARAGTSYEVLVEQRVLAPLRIEGVWAQTSPTVVQPHDRRGRPVSASTSGAYAPAGCLRGTVRGALALSTACMNPPPAMADAVALALEPRPGAKSRAGLGWLCRTTTSGERTWWHNGGTHGSAAFTAFVPALDRAVAAVTNTARPVDRTAAAALS